jgi:hydroxymethylpyrimidine kinase/phosphomethylpyrimidine kinase/thiamine-phosphate diphosphorylase
VHANPGFATAPGLLPRLSWDERPRFAAISAVMERPLGLYAIVDSAARVEQVLAAGVRTVQLRIKTPVDPDAAWRDGLQAAVTRSVRACRAAGAEFFVNDHWELAYALGAHGVHLGQEDMLALGDAGRQALAASGLKLGISSHSLWELCRARAASPRYIACGPVWPTLTKLMPWQPQGLANLRWWQHMAGAPVVAIGGILSAGQVRDAASCGVDGVCVVRALGDQPAATVPALQAALACGTASDCRPALPHLPSPSLDAWS